MLAALRADTAVNYLRKVVVFNLADIARNVETDIVVVLFVRAAGEVSGTLERVVEQNCHVLRQSDGAYKACVKSAFLGDNCGMNRLAEQVCELRFVYVKIAADKDNNIFVRRVLLIYNSLAGLFKRGVEELADVLDGVNIRRVFFLELFEYCLLYTSPSPRDS